MPASTVERCVPTVSAAATARASRMCPCCTMMYMATVISTTSAAITTSTYTVSTQRFRVLAPHAPSVVTRTSAVAKHSASTTNDLGTRTERKSAMCVGDASA